MALAQVSSLSSQDPSLSVPIGLKAKCHPYLGFARDDVLGSQLIFVLSTAIQIDWGHLPSPALENHIAQIHLQLEYCLDLNLAFILRAWGENDLYIWRKLIKNTLYCHPDYLSLIYHSPLFIPSDHEVDDLWLLCEQGVCGPGGSHQQSGGYQYKGRGWMKPLTFINFSLGSFFSWTINARNDYTIDTLKRFNRYYPGKFSHCPHFTTRSTRKMAFPFNGLLMEGHPIRQGLSGHWSHAEWTRWDM